MKNSFFLLLIIFCFVIVQTVPSQTYFFDKNSNGMMDVEDLDLAAKYWAQMIPLPAMPCEPIPSQTYFFDSNNNGFIDAEELNLLANFWALRKPLPPLPCQPTPVPTWTPTFTPTHTAIATRTPTFTSTPAKTWTPTFTPAKTFTRTPTNTPKPSATSTCTPKPTSTPAGGINEKITVNIPNLPADAKPLEMVLIPAGTFMMGSPESDPAGVWYSEKPQHQVTISQGFYLGQYEVTQGQWQAVMGNNPSVFKGYNNNPVENVSWNDCQTFIQKLNTLGHGIFRLPTEAEWEYACRAGTTTRYYWGEDDSDSTISENAWFNDNGNGHTWMIGMKKSNAWGFYDMVGNVFEWCQDRYAPYTSGNQLDPTGSTLDSRRIVRGGGWNYTLVNQVRSSFREWLEPNSAGSAMGLRLVRLSDRVSLPVQSTNPQNVKAQTQVDGLLFTWEYPFNPLNFELHVYSGNQFIEAFTLSGSSRSYQYKPSTSGSYMAAIRARSTIDTSGFIWSNEVLWNKPATPTPVIMPSAITINLSNLPSDAKPLEMVLIQPGTFKMGSLESDEHHFPNEQPQHQVTISQGFYMGKYELTQGQWLAVMGSNPATFKNYNNNPVETVSWNDCQSFIQKLNTLGQGTFRLPTEAEWEYACRAGTTTRYYWGDDFYFLAISDYVWYEDNGGQHSWMVGMKKPNAWGLYDMSGNVCEWCQDWYADNYSTNSLLDPTGPSTGTRRVFRQGSWYNQDYICRSACRGNDVPNSRYNAIGFRLVKTIGDSHIQPTVIPESPTHVPTPTATSTPKPTATPVGGAVKAITVNLPNLPSDAKPLEMVLIPAGTFMMGSPATEKDRDYGEGPQHKVTLTKPFYMGKYEVTQAHWKAVMSNNPSKFKGNNLPVERVSWNDCQTFITKLNAMGQGTFRLPTEAEWEYACRAGTTTRYYWGDDLNNTQIGDYAWYGGDDRSTTNEAGLKKPNAFGLYDMSGNVLEWCQDWYGAYPSDAQNDPAGVSSGSGRVGRGGFFYHIAKLCRSAFRGNYSPGSSGSDLGFRLRRSSP